jgi:hypothetical protein
MKETIEEGRRKIRRNDERKKCRQLAESNIESLEKEVHNN